MHGSSAVSPIIPPSSLSCNKFTSTKLFIYLKAANWPLPLSMKSWQHIDNFQILLMPPFHDQSTIDMFTSLNCQVNSAKWQHIQHSFRQHLPLLDWNFPNMPSNHLTGRQAQYKISSEDSADFQTFAKMVLSSCFSILVNSSLYSFHFCHKYLNIFTIEHLEAPRGHRPLFVWLFQNFTLVYSK